MKSNNQFIETATVEEKIEALTQNVNSIIQFLKLSKLENDVVVNSNQEFVSQGNTHLNTILEKLHSIEQLHSVDKNNLQSSINDIKLAFKDFTHELTNKLDNKRQSINLLDSKCQNIHQVVEQLDNKINSNELKISSLESMYQQLKGEINQLKLLYENLNDKFRVKDKYRVNLLSNFLYPLIVILLAGCIGFIFKSVLSINNTANTHNTEYYQYEKN